MLTKHDDPAGRAILGFPVAAAGPSKELHDGRESGYSKIQFMGGDVWAWILAACALLISLLGLDKRRGRESRKRDSPSDW
jgi:hypothetical protein